MGGYLAQFIVYTIAMTGIIFLALAVYKKVSAGYGFRKKSNYLEVEDNISLSPRKNLYVIRAGKEKFLIAADIESTTLIAKLDDRIDDVMRFPKQNKRANTEELSDITKIQSNKNLSVIKKIANGVKIPDFDI